MILDRFDDKGTYLKEISDGVKDSGKVKLATSKGAKSRYAEDYALVIPAQGKTEYRYQLTDEGEVVASTAYFNKYGHQLPKALQKETAVGLRSALKAYGLAVPESIEKLASMELGFTYERPELTLESLFSGNDVDIIEDAFKDCTPRGKRRLMIQVKEASASVSFGDDYISENFGSDLKMAFDLRGLRVEDDAKQELEELFSKTASMEPEEVILRLEMFDKQNKLCHLYGRLVPDPVQSVFGQSIKKTADEKGEVIDISGAPVAASDFKSFVESNYDALETSFGEDFAGQLRSDPISVYNSLPVTYKKAIGSIYNKG